jgi:hypothetical protein
MFGMASYTQPETGESIAGSDREREKKVRKRRIRGRSKADGLNG